MNKLAWLCAFLVICANARENPFETIDSALTSGKTTQIKENKKDFESTKITLPRSERILQSIPVPFQNLDSSMCEESVPIEENINWNEPLILSKKVDENKTKTINLADHISLEIVQNEIKIVTKDTKIRDFLVSDPYKIVIDFKKKSSYPTKTILLESPPFISATLGNHDGFYRIVILLDGHYRYDLQSVDGGYSAKLK